MAAEKPMPDGSLIQSRKRKPIAAFLAGAIVATCLLLASQWIARELESLSKVRGPYERVTWDHTMDEPPPEDFLFAMFPVDDGAFPGRAMLNTLAEVRGDEDGYEMVDQLNEQHLVPRDAVAFTVPIDELPRYVKAFNETVEAWGDDYLDFAIQVDVRATEDRVVVMLELRFDEGKMERYEYELVDDRAVPVVFSTGLWKRVIND